MNKTTSFYPRRKGDQILWLTNWIDKIGGYQVVLGYLAAEIAATIADARRALYLLNTVQTEAQSFAHSMTNHIDLIQNGSGSDLVPLPAFTLPTTPPPPDNVTPGALKRIMAFIANLKTRPGYTTDIGTNLQIISSTVPVNPGGIPDPDAVAEPGQVVLSFIKAGHKGVLIQDQVGASTTWEDLAVCTTSPYHDVRPLAVPGQPEKRRYRFCYWDGTPSNVWTATYEVTFSG
jgi:hypothetical protein